MATTSPPELDDPSAPGPTEDTPASLLWARFQRAWNHPLYGFVLRAVLGYIVLVEVLLQAAFGQVPLLGIGTRGASLPRGVFLNGAVIGTLYALIAMGLILVYRANRIINFAQAQLGAVPAVVALLLMTVHDWPYLVVVPIALIGGALLGGAVELGFVRRFQSASRMALTVVTIGVGFLLLVLEFFSKIWIGSDLQHIATFPTPFDGFQFSLGIVQFTGDAIVAIVIVSGLVAALAAFFRYTDLGIVVRAAAENAPRASLLGVPVGRVSTIVWIIAGVLSAVGVFLRAPLVGLPIAGFVGPSLLLFGLAAAVMARMEHLPTALLAGMFVGIVDQSVLFSTGRASLTSAAILVVILVALLTQRADFSRALLTAGNWEMVKSYRPIPAELRRLPEVTRARKAMWGGVSALALLAPFLFGRGRCELRHPDPHLRDGRGVAGGAHRLGWPDQPGAVRHRGRRGRGRRRDGGQPQHRLLRRSGHRRDRGCARGAAGRAAGAAYPGAVPGRDDARVRLRRAERGAQPRVLLLAASRPAGFRRASAAVLLDQPVGAQSVRTVHVQRDAKFYYVTLVFLLLAMGAASAFRGGRSGRLLIGVRDNNRLTEAFGVSSVHTRLVAFAVAGFIAALAGGLLAYEQGAVDAGTFTPERSIQVFVMTVIGGIGSLSGAVVGAVFVLGMPLLPGLRQVALIELLSSGLGVLIVLYFLPGRPDPGPVPPAGPLPALGRGPARRARAEPDRRQPGRG
jgi:branched-chain amino acid transport system permease protein